ncbi:MAG: ATP-binding cassette domain-containing protein [Bacteroidales bacterium]|nr:ATP-binding cassette domain-containing protein [Bacteroidales bacterium]
MSEAWVRFENATVARQGQDSVLRDLCWSPRPGETWAITGPVGCGKTTLGEAILGHHRLSAGTRDWPMLTRLRAAGRVVDFASEVYRFVTFKEESRLFSYGKHYYQERFNFTDPLDDLTLETFLQTGVPADRRSTIPAVAERFGIASLLRQSFLTLSNGQVRRARLARAELTAAELVILDDPFMGIDAAGRAEIAELIGARIAAGQAILLLTQPHAIPDWVTHVLTLDAGNATWQGPRAAYHPPVPSVSLVSPVSPREEVPCGTAERDNSHVPNVPILQLDNVHVRYGDRLILKDISWTVRIGERWALLGPNGAGKSTLLSLIFGDHPQAYSNDIALFGRKRGSGESIWDVKKRIGYLSPEFHLYYSEPLTAFQAAGTGFFDVLAARPLQAAQRERVHHLFAEFGLTPLADRPMNRLSAGQQRLVLFVRALVKQPPLLILDEPFQGLDAEAIQRARIWLETQLTAEQTLIFVSHHAHELPRTITRTLWLEAGRIRESELLAASTPTT